MKHYTKANRRDTIGFDRRIDREWLDATALQATENLSNRLMRRQIEIFLGTDFPKQTSAKVKQKTITVLFHIWGTGTGAVDLRRRATMVFGGATPDEKMALHWAMMTATYPVFVDVAAIVGGILSLQDSFTFSHIHDRLIEMWGKRSTLEYALRRILRSMVQWGTLEDTKKRGVYKGGVQKTMIRPDIGVLLLESLLLDTEQDTMSLSQLLRHPAIFPFTVDIHAADLHQVPQFYVYQCGLDTTYLELRN